MASEADPSRAAPAQPDRVKPGAKSPNTRLASAEGAGAPPGAPPPPVPQRRERGTLVLENIPPMESALKARLERYQHSRQGTFLGWLADGTMLMATRFVDTGKVPR